MLGGGYPIPFIGQFSPHSSTSAHMAKWTKRILLTIGILVVLLLAAVVILPIVFKDKIEAAVKASGPARLYYELGEDFHGFSLGAAWDDAMVGLRHLSDFARVAVVTDIGWIRSGTALFAPLIPCEVRVFPLAERAAARAWIAA